MSVQRDILHHLQCDYTESIRDPLWKHIYISQGMKALLQTPQLQQLQRVKQLGPTHLVYPGAVHTRFNHSLGVYHLAKEIITAMVKHNSSGLFTLRGVTNFLLAALLHDLGHFPYAHSLKEVVPLSHESLGRKIILNTVLAEKISLIPEGDPEMVGLIIDNSIPIQNPEIEMYRKVLSGPMDPDKLDYLNRDAFFCGVPYGIQDTDIIIESLTPNSSDPMELSAQRRELLDGILLSKYLMYKHVYWHPTVRGATAMIKEGVLHGFNEGTLHAEDMYGLDDYSFELLTTSPLLEEMLLCLQSGQVYNEVFHTAYKDTPFLTTPQGKRDFKKSLQSRSSKRLLDTDILIDIPEAISFEVPETLKGATHITPFSSSLGEDLTGALRRIRIFIHPEKSDGLPLKYVQEVVQELS